MPDPHSERLSADLSARYGRGFSVRNLWHMKAFYLAWPEAREREIPQTPSAESRSKNILQTASAESAPTGKSPHFLLPWSAYVRLLSVKNETASSAARSACGWATPGIAWT